MKILNQISVFILLQVMLPISQINGQSLAHKIDYTSKIIIEDAIKSSPDFKYGIRLYTTNKTEGTVWADKYGKIATYELIYTNKGKIHPLRTTIGENDVTVNGPSLALLRIGIIGGVELTRSKADLLVKPGQTDQLSINSLLNDLIKDQNFITEPYSLENISIIVVKGNDKKDIFKAMNEEGFNKTTPFIYFFYNQESNEPIPFSTNNFHKVFLSSTATNTQSLKIKSDPGDINFKIIIEYPDYTLDTIYCQYEKSKFPIRYLPPSTIARYWSIIPPKIGDHLFLRLDYGYVAPAWNNLYLDFENCKIGGENIIRFEVARSTNTVKYTIENADDIPPIYKSKVVPFIEKEKKRKLLGSKSRRYIELTSPMLAMPTDSMFIFIDKPFNYTIRNSNSPLVDYSDWQEEKVKINLIESQNTILKWKKLDPLKVFYVDLSDSYTNRELIAEKIIKETSWIKNSDGNYLIYISNQKNPFIFTETDDINRAISVLRELEPFPPTTRFDVETLSGYIKSDRREYTFNLFLSTSIYENSLTQLVSKFLIETYDMYNDNQNEDDINGILTKINKKIQKATVIIYSNMVIETNIPDNKSRKPKYYFKETLNKQPSNE